MSSLYAKGGSAVQIAEQISTQIKQGNLQPGDLLPPVRQLAGELGVNPNTVASAYAKLRDAGLVATRGRAGTQVLEQPLMTVRNVRQVPEGMGDLASGNLDAALLPALSLGAEDVFPQQTGYDVSGDLPALCRLAGDWLSQQGAELGEPAVFSGALDAIEKALRIHAAPGASVQGCRLPEKEAAPLGTAVILTPRAQNPTGMSLSAGRAASWREFLSQNPGCLAIVDDFWGPLSQRPLHLPFTADNGLYVLSLSKFLSPDLRIALACGKPQLLQTMRADQYIRERWVSHILQQIAVKLWTQAQQEGLFARAQQTYQQRRDDLSERLRALTGVPVSPGEGVHIWLPVRSEAAASQMMAQRGWLVQSGEPFRLKSGPAIRISLANLEPAQLETLAQDLAVAIGAGTVVN
ncbi:MAG: aminotransferase class I/II-fold pyridoxal phosphate-dependent enzyme [Serratia liquefaciens]|nr:aminotransferase class I/II-fold pyridoxal phosphate-dependent enzyme [Serratia liquefaciens]